MRRKQVLVLCVILLTSLALAAPQAKSPLFYEQGKVLQKLGLSKEQLHSFDQVRREHQETLKTLRGKIAENRIMLQKEMMAPQFDEKDIATTVENQLKLEKSMIEEHIAVAKAYRAILTPAQIEKLSILFDDFQKHRKLFHNHDKGNSPSPA